VGEEEKRGDRMMRCTRLNGVTITCSRVGPDEWRGQRQ
jgi:hypothetical protein